MGGIIRGGGWAWIMGGGWAWLSGWIGLGVKEMWSCGVALERSQLGDCDSGVCDLVPSLRCQILILDISRIV